MQTPSVDRSWSLFAVFETLLDAHPAAMMGRRPHAPNRRAEDLLAAMPPHLRDDLGLPPMPPPELEHPSLRRARNRASRWGT